MCPILASKFFAIVCIELRFGVYSFLCLRGFRVERDVPTTPLAKPPQPLWGGCKHKATFVIPLHDGGAWIRFAYLALIVERLGHTSTVVLLCHQQLRLFANPNERKTIV